MGGEAADRYRTPDDATRSELSADERARRRVITLLDERPPRPGACLLCDGIAARRGADIDYGGEITLRLDAQAWHLERCPARA